MLRRDFGDVKKEMEARRPLVRYPIEYTQEQKEIMAMNEEYECRAKKLQERYREEALAESRAALPVRVMETQQTSLNMADGDSQALSSKTASASEQGAIEDPGYGTPTAGFEDEDTFHVVPDSPLSDVDMTEDDIEELGAALVQGSGSTAEGDEDEFHDLSGGDEDLIGDHVDSTMDKMSEEDETLQVAPTAPAESDVQSTGSPTSSSVSSQDESPAPPASRKRKRVQVYRYKGELYLLTKTALLLGKTDHRDWLKGGTPWVDSDQWLYVAPLRI